MNSCVPYLGCSDCGVGGDVYPRHDGAGLHGEAEKSTHSLHYEESRLREVQGNVN